MIGQLPTQPPIKVLRIITRMNAGGPALHVLALADGLTSRGYETTLVAGVCDESEGDLAAEVPAEQQITTLKWLSRPISIWRDALAIVDAYRLIRRKRPHIVHTHTAKAGTVGRVAAWLAGVPTVVHTYHGNSLSGYFSPTLSWIMCQVERLLSRATDRICVVSDQQFKEVHGRFGIGESGRIRVVRLGLDLSRELSMPLPIKGQLLQAGWLGRFVPIKDLPLLSAVIEEAVRRNLPVRFLIGGDGPDRGLIEDLVKRHGSRWVEWSGWQSDAAAFLTRCDVVLQTSKNEGTPVALIQGMATGRPFVATPAGGVVDMVTGTGVEQGRDITWFANGVLVSPKATRFVDVLDRMCRNPWMLQPMQGQARAFAAQHFQTARLINDVDSLYRELLRERIGDERAATLLQDARIVTERSYTVD